MADKKEFDLLIKNVRVVRPNAAMVDDADIAISKGKFARIAPGIPAASAAEVFDAKNRLAFPGLVDPHMHTGIYSPLGEDAVTESRAAAQGGVTSSINYMRTGGYYLNKGGPYKKFFPEVLDISAGKFHVDYAYHLAPMSKRHIREIPMLVEEFGVTSFKIFMFYGGHGLHGRSQNQAEFLMIGKDEKYDIAHFEFVMRGIRKAMDKYPEKADDISLSPALRDRRDHGGLHEDGGGGGHAEGAARLQRRAPAALRGPGDLHRRLPGQRDGPAEHQPAAPDVPQGGDRGAADGGRVPAYQFPPRGDHRPPDAGHGSRPAARWPR